MDFLSSSELIYNYLRKWKGLCAQWFETLLCPYFGIDLKMKHHMIKFRKKRSFVDFVMYRKDLLYESRDLKPCFCRASVLLVLDVSLIKNPWQTLKCHYAELEKLLDPCPGKHQTPEGPSQSETWVHILLSQTIKGNMYSGLWVLQTTLQSCFKK